MQFKEVSYPSIGVTAQMPADLELQLPAKSSLSPEQQHFLICIPWAEKYLALVPQEYRAFFTFVLPYLHVRTTDVHIALCLHHFHELYLRFPEGSFDIRLVAIAFILHDVGWSALHEQEIANSLGVKGLALNAAAMGPKEKHAVEGEKIAREILESYQFDPALSPEQIDTICKAVLFHDKPEAVAGAGAAMPLEVQVLVDLDHLWSFTHENFWQDTVRKGIAPQFYLENLKNDLRGYFVTDQGRSLAMEFWAERAEEVEQLQRR